MPERTNPSAVHPRSWPADQGTVESLREYIRWLESGGKSGSELGGAELDFRGADLTEMDLRSLFLWGADFSSTTLDRVDFYKAELTGAILNDASLVGARLHRTEMNECEARRASFFEADLLGVRLHESDLSFADFRKARTNGAQMWESDLRGADFRNAWFGPEGPGGWTDLEGARMAGCKISNAGGWVKGPVDIGQEEEIQLVSGSDLYSWFAENGAPDIHVI
ncbi:pentapeptide repeat-containing protein [Nocardiopsis gilva YIM 90087]|uniref:Pentapeptide repeat-containing protein n=1 Tax=Nocardiopsis gilva YIM 90087 TaxID=1235441 RepID=A0A223S3A4_9ACTN|nr:pentapeptide repeat-containing protein [Nocardiopsis gilva]ASU82557.1 pentapeptide repeat-containing protein [Nocardiopsis gilva YIM 90087]